MLRPCKPKRRPNGRMGSYIHTVRTRVLPSVHAIHRQTVLRWAMEGSWGFRRWLLKADGRTIDRWAVRQENEPHGQFCEPETCKGCGREWVMRYMEYLAEYWCDVCEDEWYNPPETMKTEPVLGLPWMEEE